MIRAGQFVISTGVLAVLVACAGPVETRAGYDGGGLGGISAVTLASADGAGSGADAARSAVADALRQRKVALLASGPSEPRVTVSLAERPSSLAVLTDDGGVLSRAKRQRLLQNCDDRTQRLVLTLEMPGAAPARAWAEEDHCNGDLAASLKPLAERAVAALADRKAGVTFRSGRD